MSRTTTDPIADMLTRIRNSILVNRNIVRMPYSKLKHSILTVLKASGFIHDVAVEENVFKELVVTIYEDNSPPKITKLTRVSKPGRRAYVKATEIPRVLNGRGIVVLSTSKGIMTGAQAEEQNIGGEVLCKVY